MSAMTPNKQPSFFARKRGLLALLAILCGFLAILTVLATSPDLLKQMVGIGRNNIAPSASYTLPPTATPTIVLSPDESEAVAAAKQYMTALLHGQYDVMWSQLHPQIQAMWPNEAAFADFQKARFHDFTLSNFDIGRPYDVSQWVNPETMLVYSQVVVMPISLAIAPSDTLLQQSNLPPEDVHPDRIFHNLPFVIQKITTSQGGVAQWMVLAGGPADTEAPILPPLNVPVRSVQVPILMYHHISDMPTHTILAWSLTVTPTYFSQHLDYLKEHGYHSITFNQLFNALYFGAPLPEHPIILTFDDGYYDAYKFAFPILKAHGFSGMFYIITGRVGAGGQMNWTQIRTMLYSGMQMGSHTINHVDMGQLVLARPDQAQNELQQSQATLQKNLGITIQQFCYPSGEPFRHGTAAEKAQIVTLLAADGYIGATTDPGATGTYQHSISPFVLLRVRVDGRETLNEFYNSVPW